MLFTVNGRLMTTLLHDGSAEILLDNILEAMESVSFSKSQAMVIIRCGEKRLEHMVNRGEIRMVKNPQKNAKWMCNAADVLRKCWNHLRRRKRKK